MARSFLKFSIVAAALTSSVLLIACGDKGSTPAQKVAAEDAKITVTENTIPVLFSAPIQFDSLPEFGLTTPASLSFSANDTNAASPVFTLVSGTDTAAGVTTFGSCIFTITRVGHGLMLGQKITVNPCEVNIETSGKAVGSNLTNLRATLTMNGNAGKTEIRYPITIDPNTGKVTAEVIPGRPWDLGTVNLVTVTGGN